MKYGIDLPNLAAAGDPHVLADLAREAEESGWDGVFLFDSLYSAEWGATTGDAHIAPATADPWISLAAMAMRTERVRLGTMVTPLSRRRPWKLARETVTLDRLSNGRLILPVGLGSIDDGGYANVGEVTDRRTRAQILDESLAIIDGLWSGEPFSFQGEHYKVEEMTFLPKPLQSPRIPVWVVGGWPRMKSMRRTLRWDGILPASMPIGSEPPEIDPEEAGKRIVSEGAYTGISQKEISEVSEYVRRERGDAGSFDIVIEGNSSGSRREQAASVVDSYALAGATWWIEGVFSWLALPPHDMERMRRRIQQGPPRSA